VTLLRTEHRGGEGPPLVLLHGMAGAARIWHPVVARLETHHDVIAMTMDGHSGGNPWASGRDVGVARMVDALETRLDAFGLERVHLAGNSLGGWMALELARRGRALSVTAIAPAGAWDPAVGIDHLARRAAVARRAMGALRMHQWPLLQLATFRRVAFSFVMEHGDRMPPGAAAGFLHAAADCAVYDDLVTAIGREGPVAAPVEVPDDCLVRIAWGARDRVIPFEPFGRRMLAAVPAAELFQLGAVGHVPMYDDPDLVAQTILGVTTRVAVADGRTRRHDLLDS